MRRLLFPFLLALSLGGCGNSHGIDDDAGLATSVGCDADCDAGSDDTGPDDAGPTFECGDGVINGAEECDGEDLGGQSCESLGFEGDGLRCTPSCQYNRTACESPISPAIGVSRTECVAPCALFFDGLGSAGLVNGDYVRAQYDWDFDTAGTAREPHRFVRGFGVAHAYRNPGEFTVEMKLRDTGGHAAETRRAVSIVEASGPVLHVAASGDDSADGTLEAPLRTLEEAMSRIEPETTILLHRGDTFEFGTLSYAGDHTLRIGAYPESTPATNDRPILRSSSTGVALAFDGAHDLSLSDIRILAPSASVGVSLSGARQVLLMNVQVFRVGSDGEGVSVLTENAVDIALVDVMLADFDGHGVLGSGEMHAIIGTHFQGNFGRHDSIRMNGGDFLFFASNMVNTIDGGTTSLILQGGGSGSWTTRAVVVNNHFLAPVGVHPGNDEADERIRDVLFESNFLNAGSLHVLAQNVAIRNNLLIDSGIYIDTSHPLVPADFVRDISIDHNTGHRSERGVSNFIQADRPSGLVVRNNLYQAESEDDASRFLIVDLPASRIEIGANMLYAPNLGAERFRPFWADGRAYRAEAWDAESGSSTIYDDPRFETTQVGSPDLLVPTGGSPAIDSAPTIPVFSDITGRQLRPRDGNGDGNATPDFGAFEHAP